MSAVGLLAVLALAACDKQSSCRPGTVFLRIDLGPYTSGVSELDVGVSVDGGVAMHTSLAVTPGMQTGGIEVEFPNGYPVGKRVTIAVAAKVDGSEIAIHSVTVVPPSGCDAIDAMFTGADAVKGPGGAGGASGRGGEAGTLGGGAGTRGTGATGGTAATGRGGADGGNIGGAFGTGRGGADGSAGSSGRGGTGGACVPTGAESCFNNVDDDCDGKVDCADPDCTPVAQCVALDPAGPIGVVVPSNATCPPGYTEFVALMSNPSSGGCTGCSCRPQPVTCTTTIYSFGSASACGTPTTPGVSELTLSSGQTCTLPSWVGSSQGTIYGVQTSNFVLSLGAGCTPSGTPTLSPITWASTGHFCVASMVGGGCGAQACVPAVAASKCVLYDGSRSCPVNTGTVYWYTGAIDARTCGACRCDAATGGSCAGLSVNVGSDFSCSTVTQTLGPSQRKCYTGAGVTSPGVIFSGSPTMPTCPALSTVSGTVTPTGMKVACCL